jgi:hypothetical protein
MRQKLSAILTASLLLLCACGEKERSAPLPSTPQEVVERTMESIKNLNIETLNQYTDNYVQTYHNWVGIPTENEYRVFNELLQPRSKRSKRYLSAYLLDQKIMEHLTWEITEVREGNDTAELDMIITNIDMAKVMEQYELQILENILKSPELGFVQFAADMAELSAGKDTLISIIDGLEDHERSVIQVTVSAYQDNGQWKVHLSQDFINAFWGNMYTDTYSENFNQQTADFEKQIEQKAEQFTQKIEKWAQNIDK